MKATLNRQAQAQQVAGLIYDSRSAACLGKANWWHDIEVGHAKARSQRTAAAAADPAMQVCAKCPVIDLCGQLAAIDEYTGLAAGGAWSNGRLRRQYVSGQELQQAC